MKHNWFLIAGIVAVLAIPFGLAAFEDATRESAEDRFRRAHAAGDHEAQMAALDDMTAAEAERLMEEGFLQDDGEDIAEWEREEVLDISFLDKYLAAGAPGLAGELGRQVSFDRPLSWEAEEWADDLESVSIGFDTLGPDRDTAPVVGVNFSFEPDMRVQDRLRAKYGDAQRSDSTLLWVNGDGTIKLSLDKGSDYQWFIRVARVGAVEPVLDLFRAETLGKDSDEVGVVDDEIDLLAPLASREAITTVSVESDEKRIEMLTVTLELSLVPGAVDDVRERLARRFGTSSEERLGDMTSLTFAKHPGLAVYVYSNRVVIERNTVE